MYVLGSGKVAEIDGETVRAPLPRSLLRATARNNGQVAVLVLLAYWLRRAEYWLSAVGGAPVRGWRTELAWVRRIPGPTRR